MSKQQVSPVDDVYGLAGWGQGCFEVLPDGDLGLCDPDHPAPTPVSLARVVDELDGRGVSTPVVVRVESFLTSRIDAINRGFADAIDDLGYRNEYRSVFPIKVNQQADVVDRIVEHGARWNVGLEAGSKAELLVALSRPLPSGSLVVCNGVKDADYIHLAISALAVGIRCVIVMESAAELDRVLEVADRLGERPLLGVRIKLSSSVTGAWAASSGDRSTFGLGVSDLVGVVDRLRSVDLLDRLVLQHSHVGSQVPDVIDVRRAVDEACRFFVDLRDEGAPLAYLDLGGGLGVDYTGEHRADDNSVNYTLTEYCSNIVETVGYAMDEAGQPHPVLVTESGRATVALSSVLVFDVLEATRFDQDASIDVDADDHHLLRDLATIPEYLDDDRIQECLSDADYYRTELRAMFRRGLLPMRQMARAEQAYLGVVGAVRRHAATMDDPPAPVTELLGRHVDIYHGNFSVFQSLPDTWAIGQVHPCMPIRRLDERPARSAVIADATCDSDGRIDRFVTADGVVGALPVHALSPGEPYHLGVFFVGAYQETLGDLHNLFGDTHVVTIRLCDDGEYEVLEETPGDTIAEVMSFVNYDVDACLTAFTRRVDDAVSAGELDVARRDPLVATYRDSLAGYTYFERRARRHTGRHGNGQGEIAP